MFLNPTGNTNPQSMELSPSYSSDVGLIHNPLNEDRESNTRLQKLI